MATNVHLTPELEQFARGCVESGRYNNVSEVMRSALRLLQDQEQRRRAFQASIEDALFEGERDGFFTAEQVLQEMDEIIDRVAGPE
jgi:antitoxin ParD1/3/4